MSRAEILAVFDMSRFPDLEDEGQVLDLDQNPALEEARKLAVAEIGQGMKYTYRIERLHRDGWIVTSGEVGQAEGRGYLWGLQDSPGPRLAARLVRSDGQVINEIPAIDQVSVGLIAGSPTPEQLRATAQHALDRAAALEAEMKLSDILHQAKEQGKVPPTPGCLAHARHMLARMNQHGCLPDRVIPDTDGGVSFFFFRSSGRGHLAVDNDGNLVASTLVDGKVEVWGISQDGLDDAITRAVLNLGARHPSTTRDSL